MRTMYTLARQLRSLEGQLACAKVACTPYSMQIWAQGATTPVQQLTSLKLLSSVVLRPSVLPVASHAPAVRCSCSSFAGSSLPSRPPTADRVQLSTSQAPAAAVLLLARRGYAQQGAVPPKKGYVAPPAAQRSIPMHVHMVSPGILAEPYRGAPKKPPFLQSWFTVGGWKARWQRVLNSAKSIYTVSKCKKNIKGFGLPAFKADALRVYGEVCHHLAVGNKTALRQLVTPAMFTILKRELRRREEGGWDSVRWGLAAKPELKDLEVVHGRLILLNPKDDNTGFAQLTVRIPSRQTFAVYGSSGQLLAGDPATELPVEDHWVFERSLRSADPSSTWRVAGRLTDLVQNEGSGSERTSSETTKP